MATHARRTVRVRRRVERVLLPVGRSQWVSEPQRNKKKTVTKRGTAQRASHCCNVGFGLQHRRGRGGRVVDRTRRAFVTETHQEGWDDCQFCGTVGVLVWSSDDQIPRFQLPGCRSILDIGTLAGFCHAPETHTVGMRRQLVVAEGIRSQAGGSWSTTKRTNSASESKENITM